MNIIARGPNRMILEQIEQYGNNETTYSKDGLKIVPTQVFKANPNN